MAGIWDLLMQMVGPPEAEGKVVATDPAAQRLLEATAAGQPDWSPPAQGPGQPSRLTLQAPVYRQPPPPETVGYTAPQTEADQARRFLADTYGIDEVPPGSGQWFFRQRYGSDVVPDLVGQRIPARAELRATLLQGMAPTARPDALREYDTMERAAQGRYDTEQQAYQALPALMQHQTALASALRGSAETPAQQAENYQEGVTPAAPAWQVGPQVFAAAQARPETVAVSAGTVPPWAQRELALALRTGMRLGGVYEPEPHRIWLNPDANVDYPMQPGQAIPPRLVSTGAHELLHFLMQVTEAQRRREGLLLPEDLPASLSLTGEATPEHQMIASLLGEARAKGVTLAERPQIMQDVAQRVLQLPPPTAPQAPWWRGLLQALGSAPAPVPAQGAR